MDHGLHTARIQQRLIRTPLYPHRDTVRLAGTVGRNRGTGDADDLAPLQWLHRMKAANARISRWYLVLQPFQFRVAHRPGAQIVVADFLSRPGGGGGGSRFTAGWVPGLCRAVGVCGGGAASGLQGE